MSERYSFEIAAKAVKDVGAEASGKKDCTEKWQKLHMAKGLLKRQRADEARAAEEARQALDEYDLYRHDPDPAKARHYYEVYLRLHKQWVKACKQTRKWEAKRDDAYEAAIACEQKNALG